MQMSILNDFMKNELKQFSKKRNILMTLWDEMPVLQYISCIIIGAIYFIFINFCLSKINQYFNLNWTKDAICLITFLTGLILPISILLIYWLVRLLIISIKSNISHIEAIINYTRLPLTSEELKIGISNHLFSDTDTYLDFLEKKLKYKWFDDTEYINISYSDLFVILQSIKEVFGDKKIFILSYLEKQEAYGYMQNVLPFYETLDDISDCFVNYYDEIVVCIKDDNILSYSIVCKSKDIKKDITMQFFDEKKTVYKLEHFLMSERRFII